MFSNAFPSFLRIAVFIKYHANAKSMSALERSQVRNYLSRSNSILGSTVKKMQKQTRERKTGGVKSPIWPP